MFLIFDTETTGFPSKTLAPSHPGQARLMQLAWLLLDDEFEEVACYNSLVRFPDTTVLSTGAEKAHGISRDDCKKYGFYTQSVIELFTEAQSLAKLVVAHNIAFDSQLIDIELIDLRKGLPSEIQWHDTSRYFCTMQAMTPICQLPGGKFGSQYKWPKLIEAYRYVTGGKDFEGAHDALADVRATATVFKWLVEKGHVPSLCQTQIPTTSIV